MKSNLAVIPFKDGEDNGDGIGLLHVRIDLANNGYVLNYVLEDGDEIREVYLNKEDMLKELGKTI